MITNPLTATTSHHNSNKNNNGVPRTIRKRTHITASQIATLQASFATNSLPDSTVRHGLALSLGISERTVQIWFQNRRAKARKLDEKTNDKSPSTSTTATATTCNPTSTQTPRYHATFRSLMTPELFEEMKATQSSASSAVTGGPEKRRRPRSASKPEKPRPTHMVPLAPRAMSEEYSHEPSSSCLNETSQPNLSYALDPSTIIALLPVDLLRIGAWTRFAATDDLLNTQWGLICYCTKEQLIWQIQAEGQQFRIHIPLEAIQQISVGAIGQFNIQLDPQHVMFTMCLAGQSEEWVRCGDFTEEKQASQMFIHEIQGDQVLLQQTLMTLLANVPELAPKFNLIMMPSPLVLDDLCREFTMSPSATPEPPFAMYPNHQSAILDKSMMLQAPFYYPSSIDEQQIYDQIMML